MKLFVFGTNLVKDSIRVYTRIYANMTAMKKIRNGVDFVDENKSGL